MPSHILPPQLTSFIGREREIAQVCGLLSSSRLLTLTGTGGAGKSRLAFQVAAKVLDEFADGVWAIELASITDPALLPQTIASVLSVSEQSGRLLRETLTDYLGRRSLLIVLDNCEHLQSACAQLIDGLLRGCPRIRVLATSRVALSVPGEALFRVPSLSLPDPGRPLSLDQVQQYEAVRLFVERARAGQPAFALTVDNAPAVVQVCHQLDGIPLAIELAAVWTRVLAVQQIAAKLDDRFRLLKSGSPSALPRQQTLRATMDWSFDLLTESERTLFRRLSVFAGGWTLEAAEAVCSEGVEQAKILELMARLVDKSLVIMEPKGSETRYRLLETVRQYGLDRLRTSGEIDDVRLRHRTWYLALAEQAAPELGRPQQVLWFDRLEMEHDNLRAALEWSRVDEAGAEAGLRLTGALRWFWARRGHWREGDKWLAAALERGGEVPPSVSSRALLGSSHFSWRGGNYVLATTLAERGLAQCRQLGDKEGTSAFLNALGIVALLQGDYQRAITICEETFGLSRELGNKSLMGTQLTHLGIVAGYQADYTRAIRLHEEGLALFRELGDKWNIAFALWTMGRAQFGQGNESGALASLMEGLSLCKDVGDRWVTQGCLEGVAKVASARGHYERAARLLGAVETLYENLGYGRSVRVQAAHDRDIATARTALGDSTFVVAWNDGTALMLGEAIAYALESAAMLQQETPGKGRQAKNASTLTRREQEVARLVARGLTNREIATELVVTERTAETHVQNIFNKMGFTSRAQVATWATEQRLSEVAER